ncbi:hypothetical protein LJR039_005020 [Pseudorhodoferax sp. LjRoot39]|uniref:hypothetical protein n=1 Tax=Pseudorhodoferax sp. LjRoot39 TaxID=3342328 RepID=UPI003ED03660
MGYPRKFTPAIQTLFLKVLEETASPKKAAEVVGVSRELAYTYREKDLEFRRRWDAAIQVALDGLLEEGFRRAVVGVQEPVVYQGQVSTKVDASGQEHAVTIRKYSDRLLEVMLKWRYPQMADKLSVKVEDTGLSAESLMKMSSEDRQALTALLGKYEPPRNSRRPVGLSQADMACCSRVR